jgi:hypothetical protein
VGRVSRPLPASLTISQFLIIAFRLRQRQDPEKAKAGLENLRDRPLRSMKLFGGGANRAIFLGQIFRREIPIEKIG